MKYLVDFKHDTTDSDIQSYLTSNGCTVLKEWDNFDKVFLVECASAPAQTSIVERLVEESPLALKPLLQVSGDVNTYINSHDNPNLPTITISTTDDKDWWKNYTYITPKFDVPNYTINRKGKGITVYLMDSGVDASHPEFADAIIQNLYTVTPNDYNDNKGHGTALASVIVGKTCGISDATIKNVKIYDQNHELLQSELLSALDAIINDYTQDTVAILNCSWIIPKNEYVEHKLRVLWDEGIHIFAAAGNQGTSIEDVTPASMFEALTTGAYNKDLLPCDFSNYSGGSMISVTEGATNFGELDGWSPGELIWAAGLNGTYGYVAGTSIATAIASAVAVVNMADLIDSNGKMVPPYEELSISSLDANGQVFVFQKYDLLDLNDPKYSNSVNVIAALYDKSTENAKQPPDKLAATIRVSSTADSKVITSLFNPKITKKIEWITPLPNEFNLNMLGKLSVDPKKLQNPAEGEQYRKIEASFNRTNIDDSVDLVTVDIYVLHENFDPNQLPENDPVIPLTLQFDYCFNTGGCGTTWLAVACFDQCTVGFCCDYCAFGAKNFFICNCGFNCA